MLAVTLQEQTRRIVLSASGPANTKRAASNQQWARRIGRLPIGLTRTLLPAISRGTARQGLRALFPNARVKTFAGAGHAISVERREEWAAAIAEFLRA